jgi:hypothetical protein
MSEAVQADDAWIATLEMARQLVDGVASNSKALLRWIDLPAQSADTRSNRRPTKPTVKAYRKADGTYVKEHPNPRHRD